MDLSRRGFLRMLGLGATAAAVLPVEELIDRLAFARSPTTSIYVPPSNAVQLWDDAMFAEYTRNKILADINYYDGVQWTREQVEWMRTAQAQGGRILFPAVNRIR